ncbi:MAG: excinuclease ABC subunit UvrA [Bacteriovoracaceae bacterium]|nr:excinuclease ABC subunit UvrA [Bacteriovoracaceae bacterium]
MNHDSIKVTKANVHNLDNVTIKIPKNTLTVITGPSGSGKSSLAFDTIYVEGQRRYIESLSSYARQFLGQYQAPDVESITGLSPAIAIDQKTSSRNPRSTVGTITEVFDYMRVLYARVGTLFCPVSGEIVKRHTPPEIVREIMGHKEKSKVFILSRINHSNNKELEFQIKKFLSLGFSRARINNEILLIDDEIKFKAKEEYDVELVVDRIVLKEGVDKRLTDSIEHALKLGDGIIHVLVDKKEFVFSDKNMAPSSEIIYPDLEPRLFSFNSPLGACSTCNGLGESKSFDPDLLLFDDTLSIPDGALPVITKRNSFLFKMVENMAEQEGVDFKTPYKKLPKKFIKILLEGSPRIYEYNFQSENSKFQFKKAFPGLVSWLEKKFLETGSERVRKGLEEYMNIRTCRSCNGLRLNEVALSTKIDNKNIIDLCLYNIDEASKFFNKLKLEGEKKIIGDKLIKEISNRLNFLVDVGLGYLSLNRSAATLSGGEGQRIRLATQIGSALSGVLYVLDEPSIGLHQRDNHRLIETLKSLRDIGNTVLVVEHDEDTMLESDHLIDMGPGAGIHGGKVVAQGTPKEILKKKSITSRYLNGKDKIEIPKERRVSTDFIKLLGAKSNNLKSIDVEIPLSSLVCITGVSGSGKSTLVHNVLTPAVRTHLARKDKHLYQKNNYRAITGLGDIKSIIELDQSPIGRTPHSNPATYSGVFDVIRTLYSKTPESQVRGYKPGRFSFNVKGGRCESCEGNGVKKIEMHFLPDVYIECSECRGSRYNKETLSILYKGKNISDVLEMTIEEGFEFFTNHTKMNRILGTMVSVGLGYMKLGQPATTLSGGEAQRLKLSKELAKKTRGHCLYILDEPTTGLHFEDIRVLLKAINTLIESGNSVIIIEHNLDVIKTADHIIDLGPEGGDEGGNIVTSGSPEEVAKVKKSFTGKFLSKVLKK